MFALDRLLPIRATQCAGQIRCERLVKSNANGWPGAVQLSTIVQRIVYQVRQPRFISVQKQRNIINSCIIAHKAIFLESLTGYERKKRSKTFLA